MEQREREEVERFVKWWYRAEIKHPTDSIDQLAFESGYTKAQVQAGIAEAFRLLNQVEPAIEAGLLEPDGRGGFRQTEKGKRLPE